MIAHIRHSDKAEQSISSHAHAVAELCKRSALKDDLSTFAFLIGLLHDLGKCTGKFRDYLRHQVCYPEDLLPKNTAVHSPTGAIFAYERWHHGDYFHLLTAEIISLVIRSHHGGLIDMLDLNGESRLLLCLQNNKQEICYDEAVTNFLRECISETELDELFIRSCNEVATFIEQINPKSPTNVCFQIHFLCRLMLSYLVDADRLNSACFEAGIVPDPPRSVIDVWSKGIDALEAQLSNIHANRRIDSIRHDISSQCFHAGKRAQGIYSLTVPTGGGKTLSSLRFALAHAKEHDLEHIYYIVPYNTILEQNAQVIRGVIREDDVLEHHCNVVLEDEKAETYHHRLTERWDVPVILTSMVQFLNTLFHHGNTDSRRMHQLCRSVIIFDEVQALPAKCYHLLQLALGFLTRQGKSTVLLCTATQPCYVMAYMPSNKNAMN
jgi:CRISPR-associated endonuclease/helicase Cas3